MHAGNECFLHVWFLYLCKKILRRQHCEKRYGQSQSEANASVEGQQMEEVRILLLHASSSVSLFSYLQLYPNVWSHTGIQGLPVCRWYSWQSVDRIRIFHSVFQRFLLLANIEKYANNQWLTDFIWFPRADYFGTALQ